MKANESRVLRKGIPYRKVKAKTVFLVDLVMFFIINKCVWAKITNENNNTVV